MRFQRGSQFFQIQSAAGDEVKAQNDKSKFDVFCSTCHLSHDLLRSHNETTAISQHGGENTASFEIACF